MPSSRAKPALAEVVSLQRYRAFKRVLPSNTPTSLAVRAAVDCTRQDMITAKRARTIAQKRTQSE